MPVGAINTIRPVNPVDNTNWGKYSMRIRDCCIFVRTRPGHHERYCSMGTHSPSCVAEILHEMIAMVKSKQKFEQNSESTMLTGK